MSSTVFFILERWAQRQDGHETLLATWYPDLKYYAVELTFIPPLMFSLFAYSAWKLLDSDSSYRSLLSTFDPPKETTLGEKISLGVLIGSWGLTFAQKWIKNDSLHLLLPCFMSQLLLIFVIMYPNKCSVFPIMLFNIYLYTQWGGLAALLFPDLRDHRLPGETVNFVIEHLIILIAPLVMIKSGRYLILPSSKQIYLFSLSIYIMYNCPLVQCLGLYLDKDLNYLQVPPPGKLFFIKKNIINL
ncbi:TMEM164 family-domain-containing protein [Phycomyces nitens]|nr:TMEM164 family-domain-containing protein [Phycomyces nitens]